MIGSSQHFNIFKAKKLAQISDEELMRATEMQGFQNYIIEKDSAIWRLMSSHHYLITKDSIQLFWAVP